MVLSSTEEIVYRFLGFAQATRPRTCSPFHQVRAYVRSSCSSSFLPSPTSPPLTFLIDCSSSPSLLLPSSFKQRKKEKKKQPLLACLLVCCQQEDRVFQPTLLLHQFLVLFLFFPSRISPAPTLSMFLLLLFVEQRKERKKPLLACC